MLGISYDSDSSRSGDAASPSSSSPSSSSPSPSSDDGAIPGYDKAGAPPYLFVSVILEEVDFGGVDGIPVLDEKAVLKNKQFIVGQ